MSKMLERHVPCPMCTSSDAYCVYADGHGYCFACKRSKRGYNIEPIIINNKNKEPKW
jgi:hypothetical protein